jgi:hypothetical protein
VHPIKNQIPFFRFDEISFKAPVKLSLHRFSGFRVHPAVTVHNINRVSMHSRMKGDLSSHISTTDQSYIMNTTIHFATPLERSLNAAADKSQTQQAGWTSFEKPLHFSFEWSLL